MNKLFDILQLESKTVKSLELDVEPLKQNTGLTRIVKENIQTLDSIHCSPVISSFGIGLSRIDLEIITDKLNVYRSDKSRILWSNAEIQAMAFHLMSLHKCPELFNLALTVIEENWKSTYINGLIYSLLNGWFDGTPSLREACGRLLQKQLTEYHGRISKYQKLREHTDFFEEVGPLRVSALLLTKGLDISEAPSLLGISPDMLSLAFFSEVIISYVQSKELGLDRIKDILHTHTLDRTKKLVLANLVEEADKIKNPLHQDRLCKWARDVIGYDISLESIWTFIGATNEDITRLKRCHSLVKTWYARRTVETFFELACQDKTRRNFWLKYVSHIHDFKIVGTSILRDVLIKDERVAETLSSCFIEIVSTPYSTAALILFIKDKIFVEFSDMGALYVYNPNHYAISNIHSISSINKIGDLKTPKMNNLIKTEKLWGGSTEYVHYPEGRLMHNGSWQEKVRLWLNYVLHILPDEKNATKKSQQSFITSRVFDPTKSTKDTQVKSERRAPSYKNLYDLKGYYFVRTLFASDEIVKGKLRIVASFDGYCIHLINLQYFYVIEKKLHKGSGFIRISNDESKGYNEVCHKWEDKSFTICFIKIDGNKVFVKKGLNTTPYRINL